MVKSQFQNKEELENLLNRLSVQEIAKIYGVHIKTIYSSMKRLGIPATKSFIGRSGSKHWNWQGGRILDGNGYVKVYMPEHHLASKTTGYVLEHRLVMEEILGRRLNKWEQVHHKNGNRKDNRPENKYGIPNTIKFTDKTRRFERSFLEIAAFISEYSDNEAEYLKLVNELYDSYQAYEPIAKKALAKVTIGGTK